MKGTVERVCEFLGCLYEAASDSLMKSKLSLKANPNFRKFASRTEIVTLSTEPRSRVSIDACDETMTSKAILAVV